MAEGTKITLGTLLKYKANQVIQVMQKHLKQDDTMASSVLFQSIRPEIKILGDTFIMEIYAEDYWKAVNYGTKPGHRPRVEDIVKWMRHKGIQPAPSKQSLNRIKTARSKRTFVDRRLVLAQRIASAIERKGTIKRFGYKGTGFVDKTFNNTWIDEFKKDLLDNLGIQYTLEIKQVIQ